LTKFAKLCDCGGVKDKTHEQFVSVC